MEKDKNRKLSRSEKEKTIENESNDQIQYKSSQVNQVIVVVNQLLIENRKQKLRTKQKIWGKK